MTHLTIQNLDKKQLKTDLPEIRAGYTVRVHQKIKEGEKQRIQVFEGLVIAISHGHGPSKTITVRKIVAGIGVEKIFPIHSPNIAKIEVVRTGKIRRAKLYYMRNKSGKSARLKEVLVSHSKDKKKGKVQAEEDKKTESVSVEEKPVEVPATENKAQETESGDKQQEEKKPEADDKKE